MLRSLVLLILCVFALSACAGGPNATGVGASSQIMPKPSKRSSRKARRLVAKNCRAIKRDLRRMEQKRKIGTVAYDRAIDHYVKLGCESGRV